MPRFRQTALAIALLATATSCAHAAPRPPREEVLWPAPPAAPRARLAFMFPDPEAPGPRRSFWRRVADAVIGRDPEAPERWLARPFGVAVSGGTLYVADPDAPSVLRIDGLAAVRIVCRDLEWSAPMGIAIADDGSLYVADGGSATIVVVQPSGACRAIGAGMLERPVALALDGERILVADPPRHQVVVLSRAGEVLARWGRRGSADGEFHFPTGVARAPDGTLLVVDALNFRVARLSGDGAWLGAFGVPGETGGDLARPKAVATDAAGRMYVSDAQRDVVLVFGRDGGFSHAIGASGARPGWLASPAGVAVEARRVVVADSMNGRIQVFEIVGDPS